VKERHEPVLDSVQEFDEHNSMLNGYNTAYNVFTIVSNAFPKRPYVAPLAFSYINESSVYFLSAKEGFLRFAQIKRDKSNQRYKNKKKTPLNTTSLLFLNLFVIV